MTDKKPDKKKLNVEKRGWSKGAKAGAAIGSAAVAAALIYAGRHRMRKLDDFASAKPRKGQKYEFEPDLDEDEDGEA